MQAARRLRYERNSTQDAPMFVHGRVYKPDESLLVYRLYLENVWETSRGQDRQTLKLFPVYKKQTRNSGQQAASLRSALLWVTEYVDRRACRSISHWVLLPLGDPSRH